MALNNFPSAVFDDDSLAEFPRKEDCIYTPHYCEENIWMFVKKIQETSPDKVKFCYPVFISNERTYIPLWRQTASKQEDGLVVWDYHVIMVYSHEDKSWVFDFDTQLPFPTAFDEYCTETFKSDEILTPAFHRFFRVIPTVKYLQFFSSDRRHMKREDGTWQKPPPGYPPIRNSDDSHNLSQYISMVEEDSGKFGNVLNLGSFIEKFSVSKSSSLDYLYPPEPSQPSWLE